MLKYTALGFFEWFNTILAFSNEFRNAKWEPVVILLTFVHQTIKFINVLFK